MAISDKEKDSALEYASNELQKDNYPVAFRIYNALADEDVPEALFEMGRFFKFGWLGEIDHHKAFEYFMKGALLDNVLCQWLLADCFLKGEGTEKDLSKAFYWIKESADAGCPFALTDLATYYREGIGVEQNFEKMAECLLVLADEDSNCASQAQNNLAFCYLKGEGVKRDVEKAKYYFLRAIESSCHYYLDKTIEGAKNGDIDDMEMLSLFGVDY